MTTTISHLRNKNKDRN